MIPQQNNIGNQYNINQQIINPNINFPNNMNLNNIHNNLSNSNDFNQLNSPGINSMSIPSSSRNSFNNNQFTNNTVINNNNQMDLNYNKSNQKFIKNINEFTKVGFSGQGVKKVNQDNFFVFRNFNGSPQNIFMSVW